VLPSTSGTLAPITLFRLVISFVYTNYKAIKENKILCDMTLSVRDMLPDQGPGTSVTSNKTKRKKGFCLAIYVSETEEEEL
jgi:hypothetical protein